MNANLERDRICSISFLGRRERRDEGLIYASLQTRDSFQMEACSTTSFATDDANIPAQHILVGIWNECAYKNAIGCGLIEDGCDWRDWKHLKHLPRAMASSSDA